PHRTDLYPLSLHDALPILALASFASAANLRVCDPLLPQIAGEFGVSVGTVAVTVTSFALSYGVFQVLIGPLSDARGRLNIIVVRSEEHTSELQSQSNLVCR